VIEDQITSDFVGNFELNFAESAGHWGLRRGKEQGVARISLPSYRRIIGVPSQRVPFRGSASAPLPWSSKREIVQTKLESWIFPLNNSLGVQVNYHVTESCVAMNIPSV
jgi:hypothetical protein